MKTSGAKGVHVFVPIDDAGRRSRTRPPRPGRSRRAPSGSIPSIATTAFMKEDRGGKVFVDSTRVGGATVVAAYSPRVRPGVAGVVPGRLGRPRRRSRRPTSPCTPRSDMLGDRDPWAEHMPAPQPLSADLVEEGHAIPVARVQAMHEGKRRARFPTRAGLITLGYSSNGVGSMAPSSRMRRTPKVDSRPAGGVVVTIGTSHERRSTPTSASACAPRTTSAAEFAPSGQVAIHGRDLDLVRVAGRARRGHAGAGRRPCGDLVGIPR